ncbi:MAG TPA: hypothetical protein VIK72_17260 [Clostridiaceae bacterium]
MGNFNAQYEHYYESILNGKKNTAGKYSSSKSKPTKKKNIIFNRIIVDLSGGLILISLLLISRAVHINAINNLYVISKAYIGNGYTNKQVINMVTSQNITQVKETFQNFLNQNKITFK